MCHNLRFLWDLGFKTLIMDDSSLAFGELQAHFGYFERFSKVHCRPDLMRSIGKDWHIQLIVGVRGNV